MTFYDRVKASTATIGTGSMVMGAAASGYRAFTVLADGDTVRYCIEDGNAWEIGEGTWTTATSTLTRSLTRSSTGSLISLTGRAVVFVTQSAADLTASSSGAVGVDTLGAYFTALVGNATTNVVLAGDSTSYGWNATYIASVAINSGLTNVRVLDNGHAAATTALWLSTYLALDLADNPTCLVVRYGLNDPFFGIAIATTIANIRAGLTTIRATRAVSALSIILVTPSRTDRTDGVLGYGDGWYAALLAGLRQAAEDFDCAFVDIYTPYSNMDAMAVEYDAQGVHPLRPLIAQQNALIADVLFPSTVRGVGPAPVKANVPHRNYVLGTAWLTPATAFTADYRGICWSPDLGRFVLVGNNTTTCHTSDDGDTWTTRTLPSSMVLRSVCWSPELALFVAVGSAGAIVTSPTGVTWTSRTSPVARDWARVAWSPERRVFSAVASTSAGADNVMYSYDGINWTQGTTNTTQRLFGLCWSAELGLFVAVAFDGTNRVLYSKDGEWYGFNVLVTANQWTAVCWSPQKRLFVAVANSGTGNRVMTSPDATTWTIGSSAADNNWLDVIWIAELGIFAAVGSTGTGTRMMTSPDGLVWTVNANIPDAPHQQACYSPEIGIIATATTGGASNSVVTSASAHNYVYPS